MFRRRDYPKELWLKDTVWKIKFVRKIDDGEKVPTLGLFDPSDQAISIKLGQSREQTFKTVAHELVHLGEHLYGFEIPHSVIAKIEDFLYDLLTANL